MLKTAVKLLLTAVLIAAALLIGWKIRERLLETKAAPAAGQGQMAAAVEVAPVERGPLSLRRTINGTLEAAAEFVVAPKISGRVVRLGAHISDTVERGAVVAWLDDDEFAQAVVQAEADLAVNNAQLLEAQGALEIAERTFARVESLRETELTSESEYDLASADFVAKQARVKVAEALVSRARASLEAQRIRLGYTQVAAKWPDGESQRVVAERFVDEGETVSANTPLFSIIDLDPVVGVLYVPERDYAKLAVGQPVTLSTDAYPKEAFQGHIERIAPIFRQTTRQARVELTIPNPDQRLKPGMFIRATVELEHLEDATIVPYAALTERDDRTGLFLLDPDGRRVGWREVRVGIREGDRVQVDGAGGASGNRLEGRVVTLGQHLLDDGSEITIPSRANAP